MQNFYLTYCLCENHAFQLQEAQCSWDSCWVPSARSNSKGARWQFLRLCQCLRTATLLQGTWQHREHKTATLFFLTLYFRWLQGQTGWQVNTGAVLMVSQLRAAASQLRWAWPEPGCWTLNPPDPHLHHTWRNLAKGTRAQEG